MPSRATSRQSRANQPQETARPRIHGERPAEGLQALADSSAPVMRLRKLAADAGSRRAQAVQRAAVMDYATWIDSSALAGRRRSDDLLRLDAALIRYHATLDKARPLQIDALDALFDRIEDWIDAKRAEHEGDASKSKRYDKVERLKQQVVVKLGELRAIPLADPQYGSRTDFTFDVYDRVRQRTQSILAIERPRASRAARSEMVRDLADLREQARDIDPRHRPVDALWDACSVLIAASEQHLGVHVHTRNHASAAEALKVYVPRFEGSLDAARSQIERHPGTASRITVYLNRAEGDVGLYRDMARAPDPAEPDFDMPDAYAESTGLAAEAMNALGMQGTGGKSNEGLEDYWKTTLLADDPQKTAKSIIARITGGLHRAPSATDTAEQAKAKSEANDRMSGGADMGAGAVMAFQLGAELARYHAIAKYCHGKPELRGRFVWAVSKIVLLSTAGSLAAVNKTLGGALTLARGMGGTTTSSIDWPGTTASGVDMSTDVKLVGDSAGILLSAVDAVKSVVDIGRNIAERVSEAEGGGKSGGEIAEDVYDTTHDVAAAAATVGKCYSSVQALYQQISQGGQITSLTSATDAVRGVVNNVPVIPILGLIKGVMDLVKEGIKLGKSIAARKTVTAMRDQIAAEGSEGLLAALRVTKEAFIKQMHRAVIEIGHAAGAVASGALNVSGLGSGIGSLISIASLTAKLLQIGVRKVKQHFRDKQGGGLTNTEWAAEKQAQGQSFVSRALDRTEARLNQGDTGSVFDADKSTPNKEQRYRVAAMEILRAPATQRDAFLDVLRVRRKVRRIERDRSIGNKTAAKVAAVVGALKER